MTSAPSPSRAGPAGRDRDAGPERAGPPGWHADPWQRHGLRFFDGRLWTEHVADGGVAGLDSGPVAAWERSRPAPERAAPPDDPVGARVLRDAEGEPIEGAGVARAAPGSLLLVDPPDATGARLLRTPDEQPAGQVDPSRPGALRRLGRLLVAVPEAPITELVVRDADGHPLVRLSRPRRRTAAVVDVAGPAGPLGTVNADLVVHRLRARVATAAGPELGVLAQAEGRSAALAVTDADGALRGRLTPVWDVPGERRHLPPGTLLLDRRPRPGEAWDDATAALVLGALLAPALLRPPPLAPRAAEVRGEGRRSGPR